MNHFFLKLNKSGFQNINDPSIFCVSDETKSCEARSSLYGSGLKVHRERSSVRLILLYILTGPARLQKRQREAFLNALWKSDVGGNN